MRIKKNAYLLLNKLNNYDYFFRGPSPIPPRGVQNYLASPVELLPHTVFQDDPHNYHQAYQQQQQQYQQQQRHEQHVNYPPPPPPRTCFSPQLTRDHYTQASDDENAAIQYQVSRIKIRNRKTKSPLPCQLHSLIMSCRFSFPSLTTKFIQLFRKKKYEKIDIFLILNDFS